MTFLQISPPSEPRERRTSQFRELPLGILQNLEIMYEGPDQQPLHAHPEYRIKGLTFERGLQSVFLQQWSMDLSKLGCNSSANLSLIAKSAGATPDAAEYEAEAVGRQQAEAEAEASAAAFRDHPSGSSTNITDLLEFANRRVFGNPGFRPKQRPVMEAILQVVPMKNWSSHKIIPIELFLARCC